ncbi:MAG: hypothetical protein IPL40_12595 [Proteobacteria bacterium]|nr:hypothetical protein [Pseudomonadota bacterium]
MKTAAAATPLRRWRAALAPALLGVVLAYCSLTAAGAAAARKPGVVVLVFDGSSGARASAAILRALDGLRVVAAAAYRRTAARLGAAQASRVLEVDAIVRGAIVVRAGEPLLLVELVRTTGAHKTTRLSFPLESAALDAATATQVAARLAAALLQPGAASASPARSRGASRRSGGRGGRGRRGSAAPTATEGTASGSAVEGGPSDEGGGFDEVGASEGGAGDIAVVDPAERREALPSWSPGSAGQGGGGPTSNLGYAVGQARSGSSAAASPAGAGDRRPAAAEGEPAGAAETVYRTVELAAGVLMVGRGFRFLQPVNPPRPPTLGTPALLPALHLSATLQPFAPWTQRPIAGLGLTLRYWRVVGASATLSESPDQPLALLLQTAEVGARYYWSLLGRRDSPAVLLRTAFGHQTSATEAPAGFANPTQDLAYTYLRAGAGLRWPFVVRGRFELGATVGLDYLAVLTAGAIERANDSGYGNAAILAFDGSLGIFVAYAGVFARIEGSYRRFELAFDRSCSTRRTGCRQAVGARDIYAGAALELGYAF